MSFTFFSTEKNINTNLEDNREEFVENFISSQLHSWVLEDKKLAKNLLLFLNNLPISVINFFQESAPLAILFSSGKYSCAIPVLEDHNTILLFPETIELLRSTTPNVAFAVLAHELGHICLKHSDRHMSSIEKQLEADEFSSKIGYHLDLIKFLEEQEEKHLEIKMRLKQLYSFEIITNQ